MERAALLAILLAACHGGADDTAGETGATDDFPLEGTWDDEFGGLHTVTPETWTMVYPTDTSVFHIESIALDGTWLVARNDETNAWFGGLYSRFDWTVAGGDLWYCQVAWDAADPAAAAGSGSADPANPATTGCGGFAWNRLLPHEASR